MNRLDRLFSRDPTLAQNVRNINFAKEYLDDRPLSLPPYDLPCSPSESVSGNPPSSPSSSPPSCPLASNSDVDMLDIDNVSVGSGKQ